jgi:hypothetical protein
MPMVKIGQPAAVTCDFRPGKIMEGKISQIGVMAEDGGWFNPDVREYEVKIDLPPGLDGGLKPTMRCSARVFTGKLTNVLAVPLQAVITQGKSRFVYIPAPGGKVQKQPVTIGSNNESMVEIKQGLQVGDRVLLRRPRPGELLGPADAINPPAGKAEDGKTQKDQASPPALPENSRPKADAAPASAGALPLPADETTGVKAAASPKKSGAKHHRKPAAGTDKAPAPAAD